MSKYNIANSLAFYNCSIIISVAVPPGPGQEEGPGLTGLHLGVWAGASHFPSGLHSLRCKLETELNYF